MANVGNENFAASEETCVHRERARSEQRKRGGEDDQAEERWCGYGKSRECGDDCPTADDDRHDRRQKADQQTAANDEGECRNERLDQT